MPDYYDILIDGVFAARIVDSAFAHHAYEKYCEASIEDDVSMESVHLGKDGSETRKQIAHRSAVQERV